MLTVFSPASHSHQPLDLSMGHNKLSDLGSKLATDLIYIEYLQVVDTVDRNLKFATQVVHNTPCEISMQSQQTKPHLGQNTTARVSFTCYINLG